MNHAYTEDHLVEQPAIRIFRDELGWDAACCFGEWSSGTSSLGREGKRDVVLVSKLRPVLERLNPDYPKEALESAIDELTRDRSALGLGEANQEVYKLLKQGVKVKVPNHEHGGQMTKVVQVIDWKDPANNDFFLASQLWVSGELYTRRPDLVGFVNGLPLVVIEFKKPGVNVREAFDHNLADYKAGIPQLFHYNAFLLVSSGTRSKLGSLTADWGHFCDWKKIGSEQDAPEISLETILRGTCEKSRLLDLTENFTRFSETSGAVTKIVAKNHQFHGVNALVEALMCGGAGGNRNGRGDWSPEEPLTPALSQGEREEEGRPHYRGGFQFSGLVERARELREKQTPAEELLWELLRNQRFLGLKFRRQHQIGNYIVDFFCAEHSLIVEADGDVHGTEPTSKKDAIRDASLKTLGFKIVRIPNETILNDTATALHLIASHLPTPSGEEPRLANSAPPSPSGEVSRSTGSAPPSPLGRRAGGEGKTPRPETGLGVFWHTQGSGKSYSMVFFAEKVFRKVAGNWTFVVVTDRTELDDQIYRTFATCGAATEGHCQATDTEDLRRLLRQDHRYVFTLIHKFRTPPGELHPVLSERDDIIVLTDEAHRSQYDTLAMNMRTALPRAKFVAFTGTPLLDAGEELTREVFGDYVSVYNFRQSVEDGATVPLFYENRTPELEITSPELNEEIYAVIDEAGLDDDQERKLERLLGKRYHLITRDDRLDDVARDIVHHFLDRGHQGKAMVVSIDKATALKTHDKVRAEWEAETGRMLGRLKEMSPNHPGHAALNARLANLRETDMAVVVSQGQNEITEMKGKGLDIRPHRERMAKEDLGTRFKDPDDPLRLVFVCAMWLTGFDAPSCSTIYLDKPMRGHTLMQTIARANRVHRDKVNGLIVDYANVFAELEKALAIYAGGKGADEIPVRDKSELVEALQVTLRQIDEFCREQEVDLAAVEAEPVRHLIPAVDRLVRTDDTKDDFLRQSNDVGRLYNAVMPDPVIPTLAPRCQVIGELAKAVRALKEPVDVTAVLEKIARTLDGVIVADPGLAPGERTTTVDLSRIDFEALKKKFASSKTKNTEVRKLRFLIKRKLDKLVRLNASRYDFLDRFQRMVEDYNNGATNIEELFEELVRLSRELTEEEQRHMREKLSEEELAVFDILTRPAPDLTAAETVEIKKVCREMLARLKKEKLVLDWRKRRTTRARVRIEIEKMLDAGLPEKYTTELYELKCGAVFQHMLEKYPNQGVSVYEGEAA